jgi:hypothetical protein
MSVKIGHIRRGHATRVLECALLHIIAGPLICAQFPCMVAQQAAILDMRDENPTTVRPPFDPVKARDMSSKYGMKVSHC